MSETGTQEQPNGGAQVMPPANPRIYRFDASELKCQIPWSETRGTILELTYRKPEDKDHIEYEEAVQQTVRIVSGEASDETDPIPANEKYFDKLALSAEQKIKATGEVLRRYDHDAVLRFQVEVKTKLVVAMGKSDFDLIVDEDDLDAGLYAPSGTVKVRQVFADGQFDDIIYEIEPMEKLERKDFQSAWKPSERATGRREAVRTTKPSGVKKGMKYFARKIRGIEGGLIGTGPFNESTKEDYIAQVDKSFQMLVIDAEVAAAGKAPK